MIEILTAHAPFRRGIAINRGQFALQATQVFFVGLIIGMERAVLPALSSDFGVKRTSRHRPAW